MDVAQLVEPRVVIPVVVGSSPIVHPSSLRSRQKPRLLPAADEVISAESAAGDFQAIEERAKVAPFARVQQAPQATFCN